MSAVPVMSGNVIELGIVADMVPRNRGIADEINAAHRLARNEYARHAIRAGELLLQQKARCRHGEFQKWIEEHCHFAYPTAARYMAAAAAKLSGVEISKLSGLFPSGRRKTEPAPVPAAVQTPALLPPFAAPTDAAAAGAEVSIEEAIAALEADASADSRKRLKEIARARRAIKEAGRRLQRAQIRERNAQASLIAAARKLREAHE